MTTATKNAAILLAHYGKVGLAVSASGVTDPTFRKALRGGRVRWSTTVKLRRAVETLRTEDDRQRQLEELRDELVAQRPLVYSRNPRTQEATLEELIRFRDELFSLVARLSPNGHAQAAA